MRIAIAALSMPTRAPSAAMATMSVVDSRASSAIPRASTEARA
jgi:hypothetical protein